MESFAGSAFFDSDGEDQGSNLKGEYNRGTTPPSHRSPVKLAKTGNPSAGSSTTSGHYSSDSNMSKNRDTPSRDKFDSTFARNRSPSARTRSPSGSSYRYSDSFDSEASGDSRSGSPDTRRGGRKKKGGDSGRRFDSGTSRGSRPSTLRSTNSSVYGRNTKKAPQKTQQKKGRGRGRTNSNASSAQNTPRAGNVNEATRRMLSAKGHTINRIRNDYEVLKSKHDELQREFKLQKELHRKNTRELDRYTKQEESLPSMMKAQNAEVEHYRKKCQAYRDKERQKDQQLRQYNDKLNRTEDELKRARDILENKGLKERAELQKERDGLEEKLHERGRTLEDLEKYLNNVKKNQRHERRDWKSSEREYKGQLERLNGENEKLQLQLREKEKELEIKNIYSNRIVKPPGRFLATSMSPNSLRPMMTHKSTTTDEIQLSPKAPVETRRASSADERTVPERYKSPRDERYKKKAEEQRQKSREGTEEAVETKQDEKKDFPEHERFLMDLDSGLKKPEENKASKVKVDDDETMRILAQFDDNSLVKGNSQRQQADEERRREGERKREEKRRQEEEERRKKEEEEKRRKEEENKKPQWLNGPTITSTTSSSVSSSRGYTPSTFSSNTAPMPRGPVAVRGGAGQTQQHKAATSKLPWLAANSPVHKPEQERKEKEAQDAKLSNGIADSPRRDLTLNTSEEEEDFPFFGSKPAKTTTKPAPNKGTFAVNSVRGLQKYTATARESPTGDDGRSVKEKQEQEDREAEERHKKDLLLARMQEIDDGQKPDSGKSRKQYNHTDPVKNMHNGLPSHPEVNQQRKKSIEDDLTFGSYAPSFTSSTAKPAAKGPAKKKNPFFDNDNDSDSGFKLSPKHSPQRVAKKNNLMVDLFGSGSEKSDNPSRSSFGEENVFSTSTKAKPVADSKVYPWEKTVDVGQTNGGNNKPNNGRMPQQKSYSDDFDDDIEEMTL